MGIEGEIQPGKVKNHKSALQNPSIVETKLNKELMAGRIMGPFSSPPFNDLIISPLGLVPKKEEGAYRLIHDLSYPQNNAVNDLIPPECSSVQYDSIDTVIDIIQSIGIACLMAKTDLKDAFRIIPIHPSQYRFLGFCWNGQYYYDKCLPMGCSSSCKIFETLSTCLQWIMEHKFLASPMSHLLDDFFFTGPPNSSKCTQDLNNFVAMCESVGIEIKHEKTVQPSTSLTIYGITVDSQNYTASLPSDKVIKTTSLLQKYRNKRTITLNELQSLIGLLNFACLVVVPGRAFLRRLIQLTVGLTRPHHHVTLNKEARADIAAWLHFMSNFNGKSFLLFNKWVSSDYVKLYSDAAGEHGGFAAVFGDQWLGGSWPVDLKAMHITFKELFPIVLALEVWGHKLKNHKILFMCDNYAVVEILNKTSCKDVNVMKLVRRLVLSCLQHNIHFRGKHIPGYTNVISDKLSRFQFQAAFQAAPWLNHSPTRIPTHLMSI